MKRHIKEFIKAVDTFFKMEGKLVLNFKAEEQFVAVKEDEVLPFENFYEVLAKWTLT